MRVFALALVCAGGALAEGNSTKWPEVVGVLAVPGSLVEHHTDKYDDAALLLTGTVYISCGCGLLCCAAKIIPPTVGLIRKRLYEETHPQKQLDTRDPNVL